MNRDARAHRRQRAMMDRACGCAMIRLPCGAQGNHSCPAWFRCPWPNGGALTGGAISFRARQKLGCCCRESLTRRLHYRPPIPPRSGKAPVFAAAERQRAGPDAGPAFSSRPGRDQILWGAKGARWCIAESTAIYDRSAAQWGGGGSRRRAGLSLRTTKTQAPARNSGPDGSPAAAASGKNMLVVAEGGSLFGIGNEPSSPTAIPRSKHNCPRWTVFYEDRLLAVFLGDRTAITRPRPGW